MKNNIKTKHTSGGFTTPAIAGIIILVFLIAAGGYYGSRWTGSGMSDSQKLEGTVNDPDGGVGEEMMNGEMTGSSSRNMNTASSATPGMMENSTMHSNAGTYETYSADKLSLATKGEVVLFFHAPWCPTCRALDASINSHLAAIPSGLHILKLDYDSSTELKKKYGVTYQHTLVEVDANGNLIKKWAGSPDITDIAAHLN